MKKERFKDLLLSLARKNGAPVVVLIDEYDKPMIDHLGKGDAAFAIAEENRDLLRSFFGVLKGAQVSSVLRFVFITGVSKFSRVSIFSELNNLEDITLVSKYADLMGYTRDELIEKFRPHIRSMAEKTGDTEKETLAKLEMYYDGYRFSERDLRVFNPFSVMSALKQREFGAFWFETGTPKFLIDLIKEKKYPIPDIEGLKATKSIFSTFELDNLKPEALLYQTGYTTISAVQGKIYSFNYPNQEVKTSFLESLLHSFTGGTPQSHLFALLSQYLQKDEFEPFFETVTAIFASIPDILEIKRDEAYFHTIFYLMLSASGVDARSEVLTCKGRIDLAIHFHDKIYIVEFKCDQSAETALRQIREKKYADPFLQSGKEIILLGINFDSKKRNVAAWRIEKI